MKRVVVLKSNLEAQGGLERYTEKIIEAFASHDCSVTLLTTGEVKKTLPCAVQTLCPTSKLSLHHHTRFDALCQRWFARNPAPDIVFGMERNRFQTHYRAGSGVHAAYLQRRARVEPLWKQLSFAVNPLHRTLLAIEKEAFEHPALKRLFTNSHMVKKEILERYAIEQDRLCVIHNGVDWERCTALPRDPQAPYHFLFIGNGYARKGLLYLMHGLKQLREEYLLTVVGKEKNLSKFQFLAEKWGISARFVGHQRDLTPFYAAADALVIPSLYDPFANVTLEALAHGLFVVTSKMNGGKEVLTLQTGVEIEELTDPGSVHAALLAAFHHPKSINRAEATRASVRHLDSKMQLEKLVKESLC